MDTSEIVLRTEWILTLLRDQLEEMESPSFKTLPGADAYRNRTVMAMDQAWKIIQALGYQERDPLIEYTEARFGMVEEYLTEALQIIKAVE